MKSSYKNEINYGLLFQQLCFMTEPKRIIEIGILEGFSLKQFCNICSKDCKIHAYDIFDKFNGNRANYKNIIEMFKEQENITIEYGDFYDVHEKLSENTVDIIHIDIANNGDVYKYAIENYLPKLTKNGIMILEGGSVERDNIEWMNKYNKPKINTYLKSLDLSYITLGKIPSLTLIKPRN